MRRCAALVFVLALVLGSLFALRNRVLGPWILGLASQQLAERTGALLTVERTGGDWIRNLRLFGVRLEGRRESDPLRLLEASEVSVDASWWGLARGREDWLERVFVDGVRARIDLTRGGDSPSDEAPSEPMMWPDELPSLKLSGTSVELDLPGRRSLEFFGLALKSTDAGGMDLSVEQVGLLDPERGRHTGALSMSMTYAPGALSITDAEVSLGANRFHCADLELPLDAIDPLELLRAGAGSFELHSEDLSLALGTALDSALQRSPRHTLELRGRFGAGAASIDSGFLRTEQGQLVLQRGRIRWGDRWLGSELDLDLALDFADLAPLGRLLGNTPWAGSLAGEVHLSGPLGSPMGRFDLTGEDVVLFERALGRIDIVASSDEKRLSAERVLADGELGRLEASGAFEYATGSLSSVLVKASVPALERVLPSFLEAGSVELTAELEGPWRRPVGQLDVSGLGLERAGERVDELKLVARSDGDVVELPEIELRSGELELAAAGRLMLDQDAVRVRLERTRLSAGAEDLILEAPVEIVVASGGVRFDRAELAGSAGRVSVAFELAGESMDVQAAFEDLRPIAFARRWIPESFSLGSAGGTLALTGRGNELALECDLALARMGMPGLPAADLELRGRLGDGRAQIDALSLSAPEWQFSAHGSAPLDPSAQGYLSEGEIELAGEIRWDDLRLPDGAPMDLEGALRCGFDLSGGWGDLRGSLDFSGATDTTDAALSGRALLDGGLTLEHLRLETSALQVEADGRVSASTDVRAWIADSSAWRRAGLNLNARASSDDLEFLADWLPGTRRTGGSLDGLVSIGGSLERPDWRGSVEMKEVEFRADSGAGLDGCNGRLRFEGSRLIVEDLSGQYGAGPFRASGWLELDPSARSIDLEIRGEELLLARSGGLRLRADCELRIVGPPEELAASGKVVLRDGRYTRDIDFFAKGGSRRRGRGLTLFSFRESHLAKMSFDVDVTAESPFRVENNVVRGAVRPDLRLTGTGAAPELIGTVFLDPTRVSLPATKLELTSGTVEFSGGSPLVPTIEIFGQTRMRGFDVRMHATGPYDDARVSFSSVPPLSEEQLRVLVLTGQTPEQALSAQGGQAAARNVAVFLGRDLISSWFGSDKVDEGVLSRIEIETAKEVSRTGVEAREVTFRVSGEPQSVGRSLYLRAESDIYERINFGLRILFRLK